MLIAKKLVGLLVISVPAMLWQANVSAEVLDSLHLPNVLLKAEKALAKGNPDRVLELLETRIGNLHRPADQAQGYALICQAHYQKQDYDSAEKFCDKAANTGRPYWSHFNNRGVMRFKLGHYDAALTDFRQAASTMYLASHVQARSVRRNVAAAQQRQVSLPFETTQREN